MPSESVSGISLLATQTTVLVEIFLYHIPKYQWLGLPLGVKNPSSVMPPAETTVSFTLVV
ncbi:hypothetical protein RHMOL_Rhmol04G0028900 [Rhododendron molle]|uniref:Uncharacterized protein n=1 Tax=Rhododendron molle TaxID=49168 RepID=A0ACC0NYL3_RHOML|nr:hypothetical protein RHMOL_Rhmol04G0028900 [Rhododendron molle]